jgi:hypothetical protein
VRGPRIEGLTQKNYEIFYEILCEKKVPIVLVITGLENEDNIDDWWTENEGEFRTEGMSFADVACITAIKGKRDMFAMVFEQSREKVERLVLDHCSRTPWTPPVANASWVYAVLVKIFNEFLPFGPIVLAKSVYKALISCGISAREAIEFANKIHLGIF